MEIILDKCSFSSIITILRSILIELRQRYFAIMSSENVGLCLAQNCSVSRAARHLNGFSANRSKF